MILRMVQHMISLSDYVVECVCWFARKKRGAGKRHFVCMHALTCLYVYGE